MNKKIPVIERFFHTHSYFFKILKSKKTGKAINISHAIAMKELVENDGLGLKQLAEILGITSASMSIMVQKLVGLGWVEKTQDPKDKRAVIIMPTALGLEQVAQCQQCMVESVAHCFAKLTDQEQEQLDQLLQKLTEK